MEKTTYHDSFFDQLFIRLFASKMSSAVGERSSQSGYDGFVELSPKDYAGPVVLKQQQQLVAVGAAVLSACSGAVGDSYVFLPYAAGV